MKTILVTEKIDNLKNLKVSWQMAEIVSAIDYLANDIYSSKFSYRVINLCKNYRYQSMGYYVSLLAEARGHKVFPSILAMQDLKQALNSILHANIGAEIAKALQPIKSEEFILSIYFGKNPVMRYAQLCYKLHNMVPFPLLRVYFKRTPEWHISKIEPISIQDVPVGHIDALNISAQEYLSKKRFRKFKNKKNFFSMAVLHNPREITPPSNAAALKKFISAGEKVGINVELIQKEEYKTLREYDALFIRETTSVNHHTYHFSRKAAAEGLVVVDDPQSIVQCTNKVYLAEILSNHNINIPTTYIISKHSWKKIAYMLPMPCVLKKPDSSFSQGVVKIATLAEFEEKVNEFFSKSDVLIIQPFIGTDFDWRIGVLDNKPLYACKYYMAHGHWQTVNWTSKKHKEGHFTTVSIHDVPNKVMRAALRSAKLIGNGLYGVDLKEHNNNVYVIEINDNPSIDHGVEDYLLKEELYYTIMQFFLRQIRRMHGYD